MISQPIWITLLLSLGMFALMYRRSGLRDPLVAVLGFYIFFTYGPVINYLFGQDIYFGIVQHRIFDATVIFTMVIATIFVVSGLVKPKLPPNIIAATSQAHQIPMLGFVFVIFISYTTYMLISVGSAAWGVGKLQRIALGSSFHYQYLLLQMFILSTYFHVKRIKTVHLLYIINFILYLTYCVVFAERDFIFLILSLILHIRLLGDTKTNKKQDISYIILVPILIIIAVSIAGMRRSSMGGNLLTNALNEGSILFVVTTVLEWVDKSLIGFAYGQTYFYSMLNLLPSVLTPQHNELFFLSKWFANTYAPGGTSAYGFSLGAEAYLNFGYWGIPLIFTLFVLLQRWTFNRIGRHPFYLYFSVFLTGFSMYSLRNDSLAFISGIFYATLFFFGIYFLSKITTPTHKRKERQISQKLSIKQPSITITSEKR